MPMSSGLIIGELRGQFCPTDLLWKDSPSASIAFNILQHAYAESKKHLTEENSRLSKEVKDLTEDIDRQRTKYGSFLARAEQTALEVLTHVSLLHAI